MQLQLHVKQTFSKSKCDIQIFWTTSTSWFIICNSKFWSRSSEEGEEEEAVGSQEEGKGGGILLDVAGQIDDFGSFEEYVSAC